MTKAQYAAYRQTPRWQDLVARLHVRARGRCEYQYAIGPLHDTSYERCPATSRLHAHHLTYERLGCEALDDLVLLCLRCHLIAHLLAAACMRCGGQALDEKAAVDVVDALARADALDSPDVFTLAFDAASWIAHWPLCDYCDHMTHKDC
jgi:hypothetical protein